MSAIAVLLALGILWACWCLALIHGTHHRQRRRLLRRSRPIAFTYDVPFDPSWAPKPENVMLNGQPGLVSEVTMSDRDVVLHLAGDVPTPDRSGVRHE